VVQENLTLDVIRGIVRGYARPEAREASQNSLAKCRGTATKVQEITNEMTQPAMPEAHNNMKDLTQAVADSHEFPGEPPALRSLPERIGLPILAAERTITTSPSQISLANDELLLQEVAETLTVLASRADQLLVNAKSTQSLDQAETALAILRQAFASRTAAQ
jgi:hypothetical protein